MDKEKKHDKSKGLKGEKFSKSHKSKNLMFNFILI